MEIKTKESKGLNISQKTDPLKGTDLDDVFGPNCPIRSGEIFGDLETWLQQDELLKQWVEIVRMTRRCKLDISQYMGFNDYDLKNYFNEEGKNIPSHILSEIKDWDNLAKKYNIPFLEFELRRWNSNFALKYLSKLYRNEFVVEFLIRNGFKNLLSVKTAIRMNCLWILEYVIANGGLERFKVPIEETSHYDPKFRGHKNISPHLLLGSEALEYMKKAVKYCDLEIVKLLYENGFPSYSYCRVEELGGTCRLGDVLDQVPIRKEIKKYIMDNRSL